MSDLTVRLAGDVPRAADRAVVTLVTDAGAWDDLVVRAPMPHLPQNFAYGEGKRATGWQVRRAMFNLNGRPVAFATVLERRILGVRLVGRVNRGPVFLEATPSAATQVAVYAALRRHWRGPLLIAPALSDDDRSAAILRAAGFFRRQNDGWRSGRIDLTRNEEAIWAGFASTFRNRVRNAEKAGAELRVTADEASYEWMLARHLENMKDKDFNGPSPALLRALRAADPAAVTVLQLIHDDVPVAGMSVVRFGTHAEYHIGWFGPEGRKLNAGNFLMWNAMLEMKRRGVAVFDLGGLRAGDGYTKFKRTMNPLEYELAGEWVSL